MNKKIFPVFTAVIAMSLVSACGGGGGSSTNTNTQLTGTFSTLSVENMRYETPSYSGFTNASGEFDYKNGETIKFYVGDILIAEVTGKQNLSPFDFTRLNINNLPAWDTLKQSLKKTSPLSHLTNLAIFLQTIDDDADISNGIKIPDELHTIAENMKINFKQSAQNFHTDTKLNYFLGTARNQGVWGGSRASKDARLSLQTLFETYVPDILIARKTLVEYDNDNDGIIDSVDKHNFGINGRTQSTEYDSNADGINEAVDSFYYANRGQRITTTNDYDADGTHEYKFIEFRDANGNLDFVFTDSDGDDSYNRVEYFQYNHAIGQRTGYQRDSTNDGIFENVTTYTYNTLGFKISEETDLFEDGTIDSRHLYHYDAEYNTIRIDSDENNDGILNKVVYHSYDINGNRLTYDVDSSALIADGKIDSRQFYTVDSIGNRVIREWDKNADEIINERSNFSYDTNGNLTLYERDINGDGTVNIRYLYTFDVIGNRLTNETDRNADGVIDYRTIFKYDSGGNLKTVESDANADGVIDSTVHYTNSNQPVSWWELFEGILRR